MSVKVSFEQLAALQHQTVRLCIISIVSAPNPRPPLPPPNFVLCICVRATGRTLAQEGPAQRQCTLLTHKLDAQARSAVKQAPSLPTASRLSHGCCAGPHPEHMHPCTRGPRQDDDVGPLDSGERPDPSQAGRRDAVPGQPRRRAGALSRAAYCAAVDQAGCSPHEPVTLGARLTRVRRRLCCSLRGCGRVRLSSPPAQLPANFAAATAAVAAHPLLSL